MHTQNTTHILKVIVSWEKGRDIGHFQSYMHAHTKHNSPPDVDNGLRDKGESHWSLPVINTHKPQLTGSRLIVNWEEKGRGIGHFQSYMHTQNTTHHLMLIMDWEKKERGIGHFQS